MEVDDFVTGSFEVWQVTCSGCGLAAPTAKSESGAIAQWNMLSMDNAAPPPHGGRPWEILGRVPALVQYGDGEPAGDGEIIIRHANYATMPMPEAFAGEPEISLAIATPVTDDGRDRETLAGSMLTEEGAAQLGAVLIGAALSELGPLPRTEDGA